MTNGILTGLGAVITGGGRGIGAATARLLAANGAAVVLSGRTPEPIEGLATELTDDGAEAHAVVCDVTSEEAVERLRSIAEERLGGVDILVANAGIAPSAPLHRTTLEMWNQVMATNATGTFLCCRAFLPGMVERGWGRIVNIASVAGKSGAAYITAYTASKHAVVGLTRALSAEVASRGVTVNAVCPGYVDTEMTDQTIARIVGKTDLEADDARRRLEAASPQQRLIEAEEVAYQVLALCDPRARGVNGQAVVLDGGALQS